MDKNNNDLFELMTKIYGEMQEMKGEFNNRFDKIEKEIVKTNTTIENEIKPSISALLDGYKQNSEQITRIENRLQEHDEIIIRRVK